MAREYLKKLRCEKQMTMQDVADHIGISKQYYQMIENGERQRKMDVTLATMFSALFGIPIEEIIRLETERTTNE